MAELSLNCGDIAGFLNEVPAHGVAGVMGRVALDAGQAAYLVEHRKVFLLTFYQHNIIVVLRLRHDTKIFI